ncbi:MAG TPA: dephospho-CoA kinase [Clostridiales bacterium]|nr:dephospho-CoA kinase [Clostridiales bacterium]
MLIAITGGIGVGKSTIIDELKKLGANTIKTDEINKELLLQPHYIEKINAEFPGVVEKGQINKKKLKKLIFNDESMRLKLNSIAHPLILEKIIDENKKHDLLFVEIPLLYESNSKDIFDQVWFVKSKYENRLDRIMKRDNISSSLASKIILSQEKESNYENIADYVFDNDKDITYIQSSIKQLWEQLSSKNNQT